MLRKIAVPLLLLGVSACQEPGAPADDRTVEGTKIETSTPAPAPEAMNEAAGVIREAGRDAQQALEAARAAAEEAEEQARKAQEALDQDN